MNRFVELFGHACLLFSSTSESSRVTNIAIVHAVLIVDLKQNVLFHLASPYFDQGSFNQLLLSIARVAYPRTCLS